jgi:hypothetical protein
MLLIGRMRLAREKAWCSGVSGDAQDRDRNDDEARGLQFDLPIVKDGVLPRLAGNGCLRAGLLVSADS